MVVFFNYSFTVVLINHNVSKRFYFFSLSCRPFKTRHFQGSSVSTVTDINNILPAPQLCPLWTKYAQVIQHYSPKEK